MVVVNDTAVGAYGDIDSGLIKILVSCLAYVDKRGSLSSAYALCLSGNADRAAADSDFNKVRTALGKESESVRVYDVSGSDLNAV